MYFSSPGLETFYGRKATTYSQFTDTGMNWSETSPKPESKRGDSRRAVVGDHQGSFLFSQRGGHNSRKDSLSSTSVIMPVCISEVTKCGNSRAELSINWFWDQGYTFCGELILPLCWTNIWMERNQLAIFMCYLQVNTPDLLLRWENK